MRELTEGGKIDAWDQAERLKSIGFVPDFILVSSALRASQTYDAAARLFENCKVMISRELYLASPDTYVNLATKCGGKNIIIIAHDPGLHELCRHYLKGGAISGVDNEQIDRLYEKLPPAGIAWFAANPNARNGFNLVANLWPQRRAL